MKNFDNRKKYMSDMNMTPMIDVMLVLLVIFMIAAPMLVTGVDVNLPKTKQSKALKESEKPIVVSVTSKNEIFIGSAKISPEDFLEKLKLIHSESNGCEIFVKGDKDIQYGRLVNIVGKITDAGFEKVSLVTELD